MLFRGGGGLRKNRKPLLNVKIKYWLEYEYVEICL